MEEKQHKRRVHYSGKYPRKFEEKYKEQNPEKYADTVAHVISKGSTPAGMHISIMVKEILDVLKIKPGEQGLDCTLGYGGHTRKMLEKLCAGLGGSTIGSIEDSVRQNAESISSGGAKSGCVYGLDVDPIESAKTVERLRNAGFGEDVFKFRLTNFANIDQVAAEAGMFDFVLADLGVSSMQIDDPSRGFSYKIDGPLDLRLDPEHGESAAERLHSISRDEFVGMMVENSDEPYAEEIADKVFNLMKKGEPMDTTTALRQAIESALWKVPKEERNDAVKKNCARVFQALRIDVNSEFEVLYTFLEKLPGILKPGARVAILTFHSGEDRLVKKAFKEGKKSGLYSDISEEVTRPSAEECRLNPRSRSTKLRWAVRA